MKKLVLISLVFGLVMAGSRRLNAQDPPSSVSMIEVAQMFLGRAANKPPQACVDAIDKAMQKPDDASRRLAFSDLLDPNTSPLCATYLILSSTQFARANTASRGALLKDVEQKVGTKALAELKAVAQQEGSSTGTGGSTSLTAKGLSSKLLSLATEYGALTQSTSNATTTVQGTLAGLPVVLMQNGAIEECSVKVFALAPCLHQGALAWMSRISYSVSYDTSTTSGTTVGTMTGSSSSTTAAQQVSVSNNANSISAVTGKAILIPGKLDAAAYASADKTISNSKTIQEVQDAGKAFSKLEQLGATPKSPYQTFLEGEVATLSGYVAGHSQSEVLKKWRLAADDLTASLGAPISRDPKMEPAAEANLAVLQQAATLAFKYLEYLGDEDSAGFAAIIAAPPVLTAEYDYNRPSSAPSNSVFRGIFQKTYKPVTVTVNGAVSVYDQAQPNVPGAGRLRDTQFAAEVSHPFSLTLPGSGTATNFTLSGAFYDQYQSSPSILNVTPGAPVDGVTFVNLPSTASQVYGTTGNIAIGQLKLTAGGGSAVTVPLSVTYSNRTELITSPTWKAQIGVSYDFDSLFGGGK
jgi:hypothetical protein